MEDYYRATRFPRIDFDYDALSAGEHQITLQATNISGFSTSALTNIWILPNEQEPSIELLLPVDDSAEHNIPILFKIRASDPNYDIDELTLSFTSDIEGEFCTPILENTEEAYCEASLALGTHSLQFSAGPNQLTQSPAILSVFLQSDR